MSARIARLAKLIVLFLVLVIGANYTNAARDNVNDDSRQNLPSVAASPAAETLKTLAIKGRASKTGYARIQFSNGWDKVDTCDVRNKILARDLYQPTFVPGTCLVASGTLDDPYSGKKIAFIRGETTSALVQIDHVVALSDAWQKGAQQLSPAERQAFANDPLNLLAVDGPANQNKGDGDAATWLPPNKPFRCSYAARQIAVKAKYTLWVTRSEYDALARVLQGCPGQTLPVSQGNIDG